MKKAPGNDVGRIVLPAIDGTTFDSATLAGKRFMLSFFRFASCPFCNMRLHQLVRNFGDFGPDFTIVAVFDSPIDNLRRHATRHSAPFPILADEHNTYYREFAIGHSLLGVLIGMLTRLPTLLEGMFVHGYLPHIVKGSLTTMPADFLVDEHGVIRIAHYGRDEGDHLPLETVRTFARQGDRAIGLGNL
ncbi:MAG: redoxin domain-containing protein [Thermoanaerobaculia bacterium]